LILIIHSKKENDVFFEDGLKGIILGLLRTFSFFWVFLEYFYKSPQNGILCSPPEKLKVPFWNPFERIYFFFDSYNPFKKENDVFFEDGLKEIIFGILRTFLFFWGTFRIFL